MTTTTRTAYAVDHDGRLPFAPVADLGEFRRDVATDCAVAMNLPDWVRGERREKQIAAGIAAAMFWDELLSASIYRTAAEQAARL